MQTGDGLLVRLLPIGTLPLDAVAKLCLAAREHGNGIVEITARGSIQVRGLNAASAPLFAAAVAALGVAAADGVPVLTNPLSGLDPDEVFDAGVLAAKLRRALGRSGFAGKLAAKISVAIDGGGALRLDDLAADVRLQAEVIGTSVMLGVSVGGDGTRARTVGAVAPADACEAVLRLLDVIAQRGPNARARDVLVSEGIIPFTAALAGLACSRELTRLDRHKETNDTIGLHRLRDGSLACGIGLAFGHAEASALESLTEAAGTAGAHGMRAAPGRVLLAIGVPPQAEQSFAESAARLGFIVRTDDPRRRVVACAGAPICGSAQIAARELAPRLAAGAATRLGSASVIHISGCAKGCAHPGPATVTIVGTADGCALIANGGTRDAPVATVPVRELPAAIAEIMREHEAGHE